MVSCHCGVIVPWRTSRIELNLGEQFSRCGNFGRVAMLCTHFRWYDEVHDIAAGGEEGGPMPGREEGCQEPVVAGAVRDI